MSGDLESRLSRLVVETRAAWPDLAVPEDVFRTAIDAVLSERTVAALGELRAADLWLACAARLGDPRGVKLVDERLRLSVPAIRAIGLAADEVDEVLQQVRTRLFVDEGERRAKLASYAGRGPLAHWLRIVAVRHAREWRATRSRQDQLVETFTSAVHAGVAANPELVHVRERYGAVFREALTVALAAIEPDDRALIARLVEGIAPADLGAALGVHRTTALRRFERARTALRDALKGELVRRLAIDRAAADSLLGLYDTGFQVGLESMLDER